MKFLPIGLNLSGRVCIVVGGGQIGTRKATNLLRAGADVTVVAPDASDDLVQLAREKRLFWLAEAYNGLVLDGAFLAVAATDDEATNTEVVQDARTRGVLVCDASDASRSEVIFGALHHGEGVTLAVFTDGQDPAVARKTRDRIAALADDWKEE